MILQAKKVDENGAGGLIPSQTLEEKRKAFVKPEHDFTHKSREWRENTMLSLERENDAMFVFVCVVSLVRVDDEEEAEGDVQGDRLESV